MGVTPTIAPRAERVIVGIGELRVSNNPSTTLSTYGLGSCVGIAAYDPLLRAGGLIHIMLPSSAVDRKKAQEQPAIFADTGLPHLYDALLALPVAPSRLRFLIAGGASMLLATDDFRLGDSNCRASLEFLNQHKFSVQHASIGGTQNRSLHFDIGTGILTMKGDSETTVYSLGA
jgi:chemotaxis protein CheD